MKNWFALPKLEYLELYFDFNRCDLFVAHWVPDRLYNKQWCARRTCEKNIKSMGQFHTLEKRGRNERKEERKMKILFCIFAQQIYRDIWTRLGTTDVHKKIARMIKMNGSVWCWLCAFGIQILKRQTLSTNYFVWSHPDATVSLNNWLAKALNEKVVCVKTVGARWFRKVLHIWSTFFRQLTLAHKRTHFMSACKWSLVLYRLPHTSLYIQSTNVTRMLC